MVTTKTRKTREGSESSKRRRLSSDSADDSDDEGALTPPSVAPLAEQKEDMKFSLTPPSIAPSAVTQKEKKKKKPTAEPTAPTPAPGPAPADRPTSSEPESATVDHEPATADQNVAAPAKTFKELVRPGVPLPRRPLLHSQLTSSRELSTSSAKHANASATQKLPPSRRSRSRSP